jgi:hypothetical protein
MKWLATHVLPGTTAMVTVAFSRHQMAPEVPEVPEAIVMEAAPALLPAVADLEQHHQLYAEIEALDKFYQDLKAEEKVEEPPPKEPEKNPQKKKKKVEKVIEGTRCLLCEKNFPSVASLDKHCKLSQQHKEKLGIVTGSTGGSGSAPVLRKAGQGLGTEVVAAVDRSNDRSLSYKGRVYQSAMERYYDE